MQNNQRTNKQRMHRNSIERSQASFGLNESPPSLPAYNIKTTDVQKVANYIKKLDTRLSQPKLQSPARQASVESLGVKQSLTNAHSRNASMTVGLKASPSNSNIIKPMMPGTLLKNNSNESLRRIS